MKTPPLISVSAIAKYKIDVQFADGTRGTVDLSHLAGRGVFKQWDDEDIFYQVFINPESKAITWPGDLDIDTINVYCTLRDIEVEQYLKSSHRYASH